MSPTEKEKTNSWYNQLQGNPSLELMQLAIKLNAISSSDTQQQMQAINDPQGLYGTAIDAPLWEKLASRRGFEGFANEPSFDPHLYMQLILEANSDNLSSPDSFLRKRHLNQAASGNDNSGQLIEVSDRLQGIHIKSYLNLFENTNNVQIAPSTYSMQRIEMPRVTIPIITTITILTGTTEGDINKVGLAACDRAAVVVSHMVGSGNLEQKSVIFLERSTDTGKLQVAKAYDGKDNSEALLGTSEKGKANAKAFLDNIKYISEESYMFSVPPSPQGPEEIDHDTSQAA